MKKKCITIAVPVFNEEDCLQELYKRTTAVMDTIADYETELVFFDDGSTDASRSMIEDFCKKDSRCKAVFFARNYGYNAAIFYAMQQAKGDCAVLLHADLQNPPEMIPAFLKEWESGHDAVIGIKNKSRENPVMYFFRTVMYWILNYLFGLRLIPHATDFELVDASLVRHLWQNTKSEPILRIILREIAKCPQYLKYTQDRRRAGKSNFNFAKYYELAISWIVAGSKVLPRRFLGAGLVLLIATLTELFAGFLPHLKEVAYEAVSTALITRLLLCILCIACCFIAIMAEYWLEHRDNTHKVLEILEDKRIDY